MHLRYQMGESASYHSIRKYSARFITHRGLEAGWAPFLTGPPLHVPSLPQRLGPRVPGRGTLSKRLLLSNLQGVCRPGEPQGPPETEGQGVGRVSGQGEEVPHPPAREDRLCLGGRQG